MLDVVGAVRLVASVLLGLGGRCAERAQLLRGLAVLGQAHHGAAVKVQVGEPGLQLEPAGLPPQEVPQHVAQAGPQDVLIAVNLEDCGHVACSNQVFGKHLLILV